MENWLYETLTVIFMFLTVIMAILNFRLKKKETKLKEPTTHINQYANTMFNLSTSTDMSNSEAVSNAFNQFRTLTYDTQSAAQSMARDLGIEAGFSMIPSNDPMVSIPVDEATAKILFPSNQGQKADDENENDDDEKDEDEDDKN